MNKVTFLLQDDQTGNYLCKSLKSLTSKEHEADQYNTTEEAVDALISSRVKASVSVIKTTTTIELKETKFIELNELILLRNSHLDATHIGQKGNPYFYFCNEEEGLDYCFNFQEAVWEICDWCHYPNDPDIKTHSQAKDFIRINFEQ